MLNNQLEQKYRIVAGAPNLQDFLMFLEQLAAAASDIRTKINGPDSLESRQAIAAYLQDTVDTIRRIRNNQFNKTSSVNDDV